MQKIHLFVFLFSINSLISYSQEAQRPSPLSLTAVRYKENYLKIVYGQPQKRHREIFGKLVPYGEVWRTGANEATEITITKDITINNVVLKAGTYCIFTIPQKDKWTIIINRDVGLWGAYNYNAAQDIMRFDIPVQSTNKEYESFTISINQRNELADLLMMWDNVSISIPIKFTN